MLYLADETIEKFLNEDIPYLDLTTWIMEIGHYQGCIRFCSREAGVLCGSEEAVRICRKLNIQVKHALDSGSRIAPGEMFFEAYGKAEALHMFWKVALNIFEYCTGVASRVRAMVDKAKRINPQISVVTTRKNIPGTKELAIKAVMAGGGIPHRLGLSETVLIFRHHVNFFKDYPEFLSILPILKTRACEKKILAEAETLEEAIALCNAGIDGIQFDKVPAAQLKEYVIALRGIAPDLVILAAGGIHENNIEDYAQTGVNAIVTSSVYFGKPADIGVTITKTDTK
jgi:molybdenum transport protein